MKVDYDRILLDFYKKSFHNILGIKLPSDFRYTTATYSNFDEYIQIENSDDRVKKIKLRIERYKYNVAPYIKMKPLIDFIDGFNNAPLECVMDFGSSSGNILKYFTTCCKSIKKIWAIEPDRLALKTCQKVLNEDGLDIFCRTNLLDAEIPNQSCDLIYTVHTMHHIQRKMQNSIIERLCNIIKSKGIIYIYEDSWSESIPIHQIDYSDLDLEFNKISERDKRRLFVMNEFWSNDWYYKRPLKTNEDWYRSLEEWVELLNSKSIDVIRYGINGFNINRLHGVPSIWLIAKPR